MTDFWDEKFDDGIKNDLIDCAYCFNSVHPDREDFRKWINEIYQIFKSYCAEDEKKFIEESRKKEKFNSRLWEMYLFYVLFKNNPNFTLKKAAKEGPDILIEYDHRKIWIECVAPQNGTKKNMIRNSPIGKPYTPQKDEDYLIRIAQSFSEKYKKILSYKNKGIISDNDYILIAINSGSLNNDIKTKEYMNGFPLIVNLCFGIDRLHFDLPIGVQNNTYDYYYPKKDQLINKNGSSIDINYFNSDKYSIISGVLYTNKSVFDSFYNNKCELESFEKSISHISLINNPFSENKLSNNMFKKFKSYYVEDGNLKVIM